MKEEDRMKEKETTSQDLRDELLSSEDAMRDIDFTHGHLQAIINNINIDTHDRFFKDYGDPKFYTVLLSDYLWDGNIVKCIKILLDNVDDYLTCLKNKNANIFLPYASLTIKEQNLSQEQFFEQIKPQLYLSAWKTLNLLGAIVSYIENTHSINPALKEFSGYLSTLAINLKVFLMQDEECKKLSQDD